MKKVLLIILAVNMILLIVGCSSGTENYQPTNNYYPNNTDELNDIVMSREEAIKEAKQEVVNELCDKNYVEKVSVIYGTEDAEKDSMGEWTVKLTGSYYPIDKYGDYKDRKRFNYKVIVRKDYYNSIYGTHND